MKWSYHPISVSSSRSLKISHMKNDNLIIRISYQYDSIISLIIMIQMIRDENEKTIRSSQDVRLWCHDTDIPWKITIPDFTMTPLNHKSNFKIKMTTLHTHMIITSKIIIMIQMIRSSQKRYSGKWFHKTKCMIISAIQPIMNHHHTWYHHESSSKKYSKTLEFYHDPHTSTVHTDLIKKK